MAYNSLNAFIETLEKQDELIRIKEFVDPHLQITEITDRVSKHNGKALFFENTATDFPLLINAMGSEKRICMALGVKNLDDIGKEIEGLLKGLMAPKESLFSKLSMLPTLAEVAAFMPKRVKGRGKCQEVVMELPDLAKLPVLTCWPFDGGKFITFPIVHTVHPETGMRNVGMYRMQVFEKDLTGMHWHLHKNSAAHYREYKKLNKRMPVAVALGGDPVYTYCATAPMPENIDEYLLAGFLRKKKVELVKCLTCDIEVPADADFVIEGYVDPTEDLIWEGPFGDHTGFYSLADYYPKFHVTCITHRKDAIYPTTIVGIPPQEDKWLGKATERIFLPLMKLTMVPEIVDMVMPDEGVFHNIVLAKIKKTYAGQAPKVMSALWGAGQMMFNKILAIFDEQVDLADTQAVLDAIKQNAHPLQDVIFTKGPVDVLDHSSSKFALGSKMGIDATSKMPEEKYDFAVTTFSVNEDAFKDVVVNTCAFDFSFPLLILGVDKQRHDVRALHKELFLQGLLKGLYAVVYVDKEVAALNLSPVTWVVANNIDPRRDCFYADGSEILAIDGTRKSFEKDGFTRDWPNAVVMDDKTVAEIDSMWTKLGLGDFIASPSLEYKGIVKNEGAVAKSIKP